MITTEQKQELQKKFGRHEKDTGSSEVQIAILTERINQLNAHLEKNRKDFQSRLGLLKLVSQRKRLLNYLKRDNLTRYREIIQSLNLRK